MFFTCRAARSGVRSQVRSQDLSPKLLKIVLLKLKTQDRRPDKSGLEAIPCVVDYSVGADWCASADKRRTFLSRYHKISKLMTITTMAPGWTLFSRLSKKVKTAHTVLA